MKTSNQKDEEIRNTLSHKAKQVEPSSDLFNKIRKDIYEKECRETMKNKTWGFKKKRKLVTITALCIVLGSITVIGATMGKSWIGHSNNSYKTYPSQEKIEKDTGFTPKYTKELPGGFEYASGGPGESELRDDSGKTLTNTKTVTLVYQKGNEKPNLTLMVEKIDKEFIDNAHSKLVKSDKGIEFYYYDQDYKFVPPNYELTEADKKAEAEGKLAITFGSDEVRCENVQGISWYEEGLHYTLMGNDFHFEVEEMIEMAEYVINQK
ncbi:MAG: hypothetical protein AB9856_11300 [Cellulosilyticaceae bacterium]